jgi:fibro-slime domain-containing protein
MRRSRLYVHATILGIALPLVVACGSSSEGGESTLGALSGAGGGGLSGAGGSLGSDSSGTMSTGSSAPVNDYCGASLTGTVRDFQESHPDFEYIIEVDPGIVTSDLGADGKPVYAGAAGNPSTNGQEAFDQWYRDVAGVNMTMPFTLTLTPSGGDVFTYDNPTFFPIDGQGFGDEGHPHNYHFTFELRTKFVYNGGEIFRFTGDDDLFTYINDRLAIDLGGVHGAMSQEIDLDAQAATLGIAPGNIYSLDFFFAERHTVDSNFRIDTTIASFVDCGVTPK